MDTNEHESFLPEKIPAPPSAEKFTERIFFLIFAHHLFFIVAAIREHWRLFVAETL
jgi:hypothetical protein